MKIRLASNLQKDSIVDGEGIRAVIWMQGCKHNCKGCHNPDTHSFDKGILVEIDNIKKELEELKGQDGITLSGGDPLFQIPETLEIAKHAQDIGLNVWCYTGFTYEELQNMVLHNKELLELMKNIDVLVDGKFIEEEKSLNLYYRGSKNQRILNMKESLRKGKPIEIRKYIASNLKTYDFGDYGRTEGLFI